MNAIKNTNSLESTTAERVEGAFAFLQGDRIIWLVVLALFVFSMLAVYSASVTLAYKNYDGDTSQLLIKQIGMSVAGLLLMYLAHLVDYRYYSRIAQILWWASIPLLIYTMFWGAKINSASRWIKIPLIGFTIQTSDLAKLALIMLLARMLSKKQEEMEDFKGTVLPILGYIIVPVILIAKDNLSTALILFFTSVFILFIGRVAIKHLALLFGASGIVLALFVTLLLNLPDSMVEGKGRLGVWKNRIETHFMGKQDDDDTYQQRQAATAIALGGTLPNGPGNSLQRYYLPEAYSDFIYAIIIEEYGLVGGVVIVFVYLLLLYRCIKIVIEAPKAFGAFLAAGLGVSLVLQAMINMSVAVGLFPVTGVTLPLVSMGGSSVVFTSIAFGIILSVSRDNQLNSEQENLAVA
jgi:cell division protein FtsW